MHTDWFIVVFLGRLERFLEVLNIPTYRFVPQMASHEYLSYSCLALVELHIATKFVVSVSVFVGKVGFGERSGSSHGGRLALVELHIATKVVVSVSVFVGKREYGSGRVGGPHWRSFESGPACDDSSGRRVAF